MPRGRPASPNLKIHISRIKRKNARKNVYDVYEVSSRYDSKTQNSVVLKSRKIGTLPLDFQDAEKDLIPYVRKEKTVAQTIEDAVKAVPDLRQESKVRYPLDLALTVILLAMLSGCHSTYQIAEYWRVHRCVFENIFNNFPNEDISHDTVRRLIIQLGKLQGADLLRNLLGPLLVQYKSRQIAIDGKAVRAATIDNHQSPYIFNCLDVDNRVLLNQVFIDVKSNEITHSRKLLEPVDLQGAVVTADAMNAQTDFVSFLVNEKKCDYLLALKGNHKRLNELIKTLFELEPNDLQRRTLKGIAQWHSKTAQKQDKGHGRTEIRSVRVLPACLLGEEFLKEWAGLEDGCIVEAVTDSTNVKSNKTSSQTRYFISSLRFEEHFVAQQIMHRIRGHWCIENNLHFELDYTFLEDRTQCTNADFLVGKTTITKLTHSLLSKAQEMELMDDGIASSKPVWKVRLSRPENIFLILRKLFDRFKF